MFTADPAHTEAGGLLKNAQHQAWGCLTNTKKGRDTWHTATQEDNTLVTNKNFQTGRGSSSLENVKWTNRAMDLGSDHCIIEVVIEVARNKTSTFKFIEWDLFRANRSERSLPR
ncbi:hypothetical protein HPB52_002256 [Rhipicephalus sanguineus]|uniref:Tick transposon n=1 Tax=Rhipicephalus sanguineus TaxID=34632 RepID=A0A9D4QGA5_RHISA|nr:hypothetical protein HPB52_002256 [Rhipicephalus sanguineus]